MNQFQDVLTIATRRRGHHNITAQVAAWLARQPVRTGLLVLMVQHVRAALSIRENVDRDDLHAFFNTLEGDASPMGEVAPLYATQLSIPVRGGALTLGARQGVFLFEDRDAPHRRDVVLHLIGD